MYHDYTYVPYDSLLVSSFYYFEWSVDSSLPLGLFTFPSFIYHCFYYKCYNFLCHQIRFTKFMNKRIVTCMYSYFCSFLLFLLPSGCYKILSFIIFFFVWRISFNQALRADLLATNSFSFPSSEDVCIYPSLLKVSFTGYRITEFSHLGKDSALISFNILSASLFFSSHSETLMIQISDFLLLSCKSLRFCWLIFSLFALCCLDCMNYITLSSNLLILSADISTLLLGLSLEFL